MGSPRKPLKALFLAAGASFFLFLLYINDDRDDIQDFTDAYNNYKRLHPFFSSITNYSIFSNSCCQCNEPISAPFLLPPPPSPDVLARSPRAIRSSNSTQSTHPGTVLYLTTPPTDDSSKITPFEFPLPTFPLSTPPASTFPLSIPPAPTPPSSVVPASTSPSSVAPASTSPSSVAPASTSPSSVAPSSPSIPSITTDFVTLSGRNVHVKCLHCAECNYKFKSSDDYYLGGDNKLYCPYHFQVHRPKNVTAQRLFIPDSHNELREMLKKKETIGSCVICEKSYNFQSWFSRFMFWKNVEMDKYGNLICKTHLIQPASSPIKKSMPNDDLPCSEFVKQTNPYLTSPAPPAKPCERCFSCEGKNGIEKRRLYRYEDGRCVCGICLDQRIQNVNDVNVLSFSIDEMLRKLGLVSKRPLYDIPVEFYDLSKETYFSEGSRKGQIIEGACVKHFTENPKKKIISFISTIRLMSGLTHLYSSGILAHELSHAYIAYAFPEKKLTEEVEEGLCELIRYIWLTGYANPSDGFSKEAVFILKRMHSPFEKKVTPLEKALIALRGRTVSELFEYVKENGNFPPTPTIQRTS